MSSASQPPENPSGGTPRPASPAAPVTAQIVRDAPQTIVIERPRGSRLGRRLLTAALVVSVLVNLSLYGAFHDYFQTDAKLVEKFHSGEWTASDKVAVISIEGAILDGDGFVKSQIDHIREDDGVKAVVLRVDSPGGTISASDSIYHQLRKLVEEKDIPLVVSMGGMAASGGYYVAMCVGDQTDAIFAEPTTWTGSIGVIIPHYNIGGLLESLHIENDSIKSHPLKDLGSMTRQMTPEERAILQQLVDDSLERFKNVVKSGRPMLREDEAALDAVATGQIFTADQAIANKLVDKEGFLDDAIGRALELAGLKLANVRVIEFDRTLGLSDVLLGASAEPRDLSLSSFVELATPRAYYLCTWLPPLSTMAKP